MISHSAGRSTPTRRRTHARLAGALVIASLAAAPSLRGQDSAHSTGQAWQLVQLPQSSLVLARCKESDQSAYEPLFQKASNLLNLYRELLSARTVVPQDLPKAVESATSKSSKAAPER